MFVFKKHEKIFSPFKHMQNITKVQIDLQVKFGSEKKHELKCNPIVVSALYPNHVNVMQYSFWMRTISNQ